MDRIRRNANDVQKSIDGGTSFDLARALVDCMSLLGVIGSAAAHKGDVSARTADKIMLFLVDLACTGASLDTLQSGQEQQIDLQSMYDGGDLERYVSVRIASALGTMLSWSMGSALWKQRLAHIASKRIQQCLSDKSDVSVGVLACVGHLLCCSDVRTLALTQQQLFARVIVRGLAPQVLSTVTKDTASVMKLSLAALVKLLSVVPTATKDLAYPIITGSMRAYAKADEFDMGAGLACKLLALQTLQAATYIVGAAPVVKDAKAPVVSILGVAMNHPSSLLRQAAVEVRNTWLLID